MSQDAEIVLTQKHRTGGERTLTLFKQRYLRVVRRRRAPPVRFTLDLLALAMDSERYRCLRWGWLVGAAFALLWVIIGAVLVFWPPGRDTRLAGAALVAGGALAVLLCVVRFVVSIEYRQVYATRYAGVPLIELWVNRPDSGFYQAFVQELERAIVNAHEQADDIGLNARKAGELRLLRRFARKGVIGEAVYEEAKALILAQD